jgi:hypothetical protein
VLEVKAKAKGAMEQYGHHEHIKYEAGLISLWLYKENNKLRD